MDELYAFLFGGLAIMFLLFAFFGGPHVDLNYGTESGGTDYQADNLTWKEVDLGDVISKERTVSSSELLENNLSVQNGFFFGSREYARQIDEDPYIVNNFNNATISFNVADTNNYGFLDVSINNQSLMTESPLKGRYAINLSKLNKTSVLYIRTTSSGWRVWAPSKYDLTNLSLNVVYTTKETPSYDFDVPHYVYNSFYKGELKFDSIYPVDLKVLVNGDVVYHNMRTYGRTTISLSKKNIGPETNAIEFDSTDDFRLEGAKINLYYRS